LVEAAEALGVDKNSLQAYEVGTRLPDIRFLAHAARRYHSDFRHMLALLLRDQTLRHSDPPVPDPVCAMAADQIKVMDYARVLDPKSDFAKALDHERLTNILYAVGRAESKTGKRLLPKNKARIVSALYGVTVLDGPDADLGIEYLMKIIRENHKENLEK
jgi:hypothetical protein